MNFKLPKIRCENGWATAGAVAWTDFSFEQHAADVAALIKKLNLGKVHLLGHSRGGGDPSALCRAICEDQ